MKWNCLCETANGPSVKMVLLWVNRGIVNLKFVVCIHVVAKYWNQFEPDMLLVGSCSIRLAPSLICRLLTRTAMATLTSTSWDRRCMSLAWNCRQKTLVPWCHRLDAASLAVFTMKVCHLSLWTTVFSHLLNLVPCHGNVIIARRIFVARDYGIQRKWVGSGEITSGIRWLN